MTWLYVPSISFPSVMATAAPSSPCDPWYRYEPYVVLSGMPTRRPSSWRGWKNRDWISLLSGMTYAPSTAQRGVGEWILSLPVSPVSPSPLPVQEVELTMIAGSGQTSAGLSLTWDRDGSCWKTSASLFDMDYPKSSTTLPSTGSMRNGVCTPQPPLVPLTNVNGSGSWPKPTGMDSRSSGGNPNTTGSHGTTLTDATVRSAMWGTPVARDDQKSPEAHLAMKDRMGGNRTAVTSLTVQAEMWPTPRASMAFCGDDNASSNPNSGGHGLKHTAGLHAPTIMPDGSSTSPKADLNPSFVAALMGLPLDWLTPFTSAETDSSPNAPPSRGANSLIA